MTEPFLEQPASHLPPPEKIGKYKIEGLLEYGGMSLLYLASHPDTGEPIVIKVLSPKYLANQEATKRFLNEAHIISLACHPNIVKLYDWGSWERGFFIAMEYVHATSLRYILKNHPFSLRRALDIILQISYALCHLHAHGIVHGDLKPENVLVTRDGKIKIIDFGIAQILETPKNKPLKEDAKLIGTPIYMAPEVLKSSQNYSFQSDIYSLGILTYELTLGKISHGRILLSLAPKGLQSILTKTLQPNPEDRYQDIIEFITDIKAYVDSERPEKDKQGPDYFFEFFEKIEEFQRGLLPLKTPSWQGIEIGVALSPGSTLGSLYYDFLNLSTTKKAIFISTIPQHESPGSLFSCILKGIVHTLAKHTKYTSQKFFEAIQDEIKTEILNEKINIAFLSFDTETKVFEFYSSSANAFSHSLLLKQAPFYKTNEECSSAGYFHLQTTPERNMHFLFLGTAELPATENQHTISREINRLFEHYLHLTPERQAENILHKLRVLHPDLSQKGPAIVLVLHISNP